MSCWIYYSILFKYIWINCKEGLIIQLHVYNCQLQYTRAIPSAKEQYKGTLMQKRKKEKKHKEMPRTSQNRHTLVHPRTAECGSRCCFLRGSLGGFLWVGGWAGQAYPESSGVSIDLILNLPSLPPSRLMFSMPSHPYTHTHPNTYTRGEVSGYVHTCLEDSRLDLKGLAG